MLTADFWQGALLMVLILAVVYGVLAMSGRLPHSVSKISDLEGTVRVLQRDHIDDQKRMAALEAKNNELEQKNAVLSARVQALEQELLIYKPRAGDAPVTDRVLLAVIGNQAELKLDLSALREVEAETGIVVTRCYPARFPRFEATLNRYRAAGTPIKYVHFSVHASAGDGNPVAAAALFEDGAVGGEQLSGVLNGVEVAFVAGCDAEILGDLLGVIPTVVTFKEPVRHEQAALATKLFWLAIGHGLAPRAAYREARSRLPAEIAEFLELHQ